VKESQPTRGTHSLSSAGWGTGQDNKRKPASEGNSRSVERSKELVRAAKESQSARGTHILSSTEQGTGHDSKRMPASEGNSQTVKHRARDR
jgi:hypothetical protein